MTNANLIIVSAIDALVERFNQFGKPSRHRYISADGRYIYNLAIIDYLQAYDLEK